VVAVRLHGSSQKSSEPMPISMCPFKCCDRANLGGWVLSVGIVWCFTQQVQHLPVGVGDRNTRHEPGIADRDDVRESRILGGREGDGEPLVGIDKRACQGVSLQVEGRVLSGLSQIGADPGGVDWVIDWWTVT
jgi:hypothetical protein